MLDNLLPSVLCVDLLMLHHINQTDRVWSVHLIHPCFFDYRFVYQAKTGLDLNQNEENEIPAN